MKCLEIGWSEINITPIKKIALDGQFGREFCPIELGTWGRQAVSKDCVQTACFPFKIRKIGHDFEKKFSLTNLSFHLFLNL